MADEHLIKIDADGNAVCLYSDELPLREIGDLTVVRANNVEFDNERGGWIVIFPLRDGATIPEYLCLEALPEPWAVDQRTLALHRATVFASREDAIGAEIAYTNARL